MTEQQLRELRADFETIVEQMQSAERPGAEAAGIAFVAAEHGLELVHRAELDLIWEATR